MAAKGSAAKSASGAAMSRYDVEVEARLKALEGAQHSHSGGDSADLLQRIEALEKALGHLKKTSIWNSKWD
tara:strand:+ start:282 stop:494 length:213 start_codon:yes stop_codon:yes gene_type:complete